VSRTSDDPDLVLGVAALGSAYLGQVPLSRLHAAELVDQRTPAAVARLNAMLTWEPQTAIGHTEF
jgi:hypothetical protein